ncbi:MAG: cyclopropane-fatty-acyl-phospholipid synthase family protein [Planctomycetota bacterium]|nr:cyclopropane-fatty-acyl-phospholipid synthase family protein [Planctomycetota bacterium]MCX8040650.1 cyclopropane-fatty-acyl-phospholipid synthase family protein [Planctomycetota bacterium]MDW8372793.1 cyclopropane-fatty-acyl-phospholipid synthase family protein [Planctomycetota bacterium]
MTIVTALDSDSHPMLAPRPLARWLRRHVLAALRDLECGALTISDAEGSERCGRNELQAGDLRAHITVHHPDFWVAVGLGGSVGAGAAYARGWWDADHLTAVIRLLARNQAALARLDGGWNAWIAAPLRRLLSWWQRNTIEGAARNIAAHYDLGNEFFALMLDPTMAYSSAVFPHPNADLESAQLHKFDLVCQALELKPGERVIEIGSGWGGFAIHAARHYGVRVVTTTISRAQYELARQRVQQAGLEERVTVVMRDYRELSGVFDKLVSIEMVEAVGHEYLPTYMATCGRLLAPHGAALIQAITIADQRYERARREVDFIKRFIFPGSCLPSLTRLLACATAASDLRLAAYHDYTPHYARTLARWRERCRAHAAQIAALGYPLSFRRLWDFYLAYCEGGFAERTISVGHLLFVKPGWRQAGHRSFGYA